MGEYQAGAVNGGVIRFQNGSQIAFGEPHKGDEHVGLPDRSEGHLAFIDGHEFFEFRGQVLRAPVAAQVGPSGMRLGRSFACFLSAWEEHRKTL